MLSQFPFGVVSGGLCVYNLIGTAMGIRKTVLSICNRF